MAASYVNEGKKLEGMKRNHTELESCCRSDSGFP